MLDDMLQPLSALTGLVRLTVDVETLEGGPHGLECVLASLRGLMQLHIRSKTDWVHMGTFDMGWVSHLL